MNRYHLYETFIVYQYILDNWEITPYHPSCFEIIFIEDGNGYCRVNDIRRKYRENDIFLLAPEDTHHFEINKRSKFTHFKFTKLLFSSKVNLPDRKYWLQRIEQLLHHSNNNTDDVISNKNDQKIIWNIHKIILEEFRNKNPFYPEIISNGISTILSIFVRNLAIAYKTNKTATNNSTIEQIVDYIKQNAYDNDLTKIHKMAENFKMSQSAISSHFKKMTGQSIHQYITKYKMELVEYRLRHTIFTIAEIAYQLGYTDESHLTKAFKKRFTISPKQYRDKLIEANNS